MSWQLTTEERNLCPEEFQLRLNQVGGLNRYDEANFRLSWAQTETTRMAGWSGYEDMLLGLGEPAWMVLQWNPGEFYGTPESWYAENFDEQTGLCLLGEYPFKGRYEVIYTLIHRELINGDMHVYRLPLTSMLLDRIIPLVMEAEDMTIEKKRAAFAANKEREEQEMVAQIEGMKRDARPVFGGGSISFTRQGVRTSLVDQKMRQMASRWAEAAKEIAQLGKGLQMRTF